MKQSWLLFEVYLMGRRYTILCTMIISEQCGIATFCQGDVKPLLTEEQQPPPVLAESMPPPETELRRGLSRKILEGHLDQLLAQIAPRTGIALSLR